MFYTVRMPARGPRELPKTSLSIKLGGWLEANATGWGVVAVPIVVALVLVAAGLKIWLAETVFSPRVERVTHCDQTDLANQTIPTLPTLHALVLGII